MTECAPLISFIEAEEWRLRSCGRVLEPYMEARIAPLNDEQNPSAETSEIGEIQVRGENVCMGYYKNPEQTAALFTEDGWMRTGDLGTMDNDHFLYIRGRSKAMLLGSNGQNIYPEELEAKIGMLPYVQESLVLMRDGKLEALIVPNMQLIEQAGITLDEAGKLFRASALLSTSRSVATRRSSASSFVPSPLRRLPSRAFVATYISRSYIHYPTFEAR